MGCVNDKQAAKQSTDTTTQEANQPQTAQKKEETTVAKAAEAQAAESNKEQEAPDSKKKEEETQAAEAAAAAAAAAKKQKEEQEAAAKKKEEEAAAKKKREEEAAAAKKKKEEEAAAAKKKKEEEAAAKKKQKEEEAAAKKKQKEEEEAKKKEEEEVKKKQEEAANMSSDDETPKDMNEMQKSVWDSYQSLIPTMGKAQALAAFKQSFEAVGLKVPGMDEGGKEEEASELDENGVPKNMNEGQKSVWNSYMQMVPYMGKHKAMETFAPSFKAVGLKLPGMEEKEEVVSGPEEFELVHDPLKGAFVAKWTLPGVKPTTSDYIYLVKAGTSHNDSYITYEYNREAKKQGSVDLTTYQEIEPGEYEAHYVGSADTTKVLAKSKPCAPVSFQEARDKLPGKLKATWDAVKTMVVIEFDLSAVPDFKKRSNVSLNIFEKTAKNNTHKKYSQHTGEIKGNSFIGVSSGECDNGVEYNVRIIHDYEALAISNDFTVSGLKERVNSEACKIEVKFDPKTCTAEVSWSFPEDFDQDLNDSDSLTLFKAGSTYDTLDESTNCSIYTSKLRKGDETLAMAGYCENGQDYEVRYLSSTRPTKSFGISTKFSVNGVDKKFIGYEHISPSAMQNAGSMTRNMAKKAKADADVGTNPLLAVQPDKSFKLSVWAHAYRADQAKAKAAAAAAKKQAILEEKVAAGGIFDVIPEQQLEQELMKSLETAKGLIYAGAGVSMSAPSCSPSWWRLMSELVEATFNAAPEKHKNKKVGSSDASRQPEEVMESFYYIIQQKLLTVFQLLEEGRPNANHVAMAKMVKTGKIKAIFTTNFDVFIERALREEGVEFKVVVTAEEFKEYLDGGMKDFAVLKIHGTVERPDTIVAVANHYKMGKGFSGAKADVLGKLLQDCPTVFLGYSGWDFLHKNYQSFLADVGAAGGANVYWLTLRGFGGGPDLGKVVGTHIGRRLRIGEGMLPDFAAHVVEAYAPGEGNKVMAFHQGIDSNAEFAAVTTKRKAFLDNWVRELPMSKIMALVAMESQRLNSAIQDRLKKSKDLADETDDAQDTNALTSAYMELSNLLTTQQITQDEYDRRQQELTLDQTFRYMLASQAHKKQLKEKVKEVQQNNELMKKDTMAKHLLPSILMSVVEAVDMEKIGVDGVINLALKHLGKVSVLKMEGTQKSQVMADTYTYCMMMLRGSDEDQKMIDGWIEELAVKLIEMKASDEVMSNERMKLNNKIMQLTLGTVDMEAILDTQLKSTMEIKDDDTFLDAATAISLTLVRQADQRSQDFSQMPGFSQKVTQPLAMNPKADLAGFVFKEFEDRLNEPFKPLEERLKGMGEKGEAVLATFDIAALAMWYPATKYLGGYNKQQSREFAGLYPKETIPRAIVEYMLPRLQKAKQSVKDERFLQPLYSLLAIMGEATDNIELVKEATEASLELTQGKVTELTPYPIPESLAVQYLERKDYANANKWFDLAVDGIKTCVMRTKTDSIVLNVCLLKAQTSKKDALKIAFACSPMFGNAIAYSGGIPSICRAILIQQMEVWVKDLGFSSVFEAESKLMSAEE